jgi:hypothetical protein
MVGEKAVRSARAALADRLEEPNVVYRGRVKNGVVVLEGRVRLEEGAEVSVRPLRKGRRPARRKKEPPTLYERYKRFIGMANGLPTDFSINHDHYLYRTPKRS